MVLLEVYTSSFTYTSLSTSSGKRVSVTFSQLDPLHDFTLVYFGRDIHIPAKVKSLDHDFSRT